MAALSVSVVIIWFVVGTVATNIAMQYSNYIDFLGGLAIVILGIIAIRDAVRNIKSNKRGE